MPPTKPKTVRVRAMPGKLVPFHPNTITAPGARQLVLASGEEVEVPLDQFIRRRILAGDLEIVKTPTPTTKPAKE